MKGTRCFNPTSPRHSIGSLVGASSCIERQGSATTGWIRVVWGEDQCDINNVLWCCFITDRVGDMVEGVEHTTMKQEIQNRWKEAEKRCDLMSA